MIDGESLVKTILANRKQIARPNGNVSLWEKWLKGKDPSFHNYKIYNGERTIRCERFSMHMGKKVCEDWAALLMNEKVSIGVKNQDLLEKVLLAVDFYNKTNKSVEVGFALSMAGVSAEIENLKIEYDLVKDKNDTQAQIKNATITITPQTKVGLGVYSAKKTVPITIENGDVTECAFVQENSQDTKIIIHTKNENGGYTVTVCNVVNESGAIMSAYSFDVKYKLFAVVYPRIVNNMDVDSQYPISIYANAIDTLKSIDLAFDSYANELNLGRKRIFVSSDMDKVDKETGEITRYFDPHDVIIHQLPPTTAADGSSKPMIHEVNGELRVAQISQAIQDLLNYLSSQVGLGVDYYRFEKGRVQTATQVISEKSDTFRNLKKHEGVCEKMIYTIVVALQYLHNEFTLSKEKFQDIETVEIHFDDSIIEDKATEKSNDQKDLEFGAMSLIAYRMKWFAETEEEATKQMKLIYGDSNLLKRLQNFTPYLTQGTMTPLQFVKNVYIDITDETEQQTLAEEIAASMKASSEVITDDDVPGLYTPPGEESGEK